LIQAIPTVLKEEPKTKFLIAGEGFQKEALKREVENLDVHSSVTFLGQVLHEDMPDLLSQVDIYVSTSLHDGTSVSLLEAMGSGAFPVVTDIPSNREWVSDGENGFLVSQKDKNLLGRRIVGAIRDQRLMSEACTKNREIIEKRACWRQNIKRISRLYQNLP
jgi:glycosyltransferase involved in cell wall biosynthesis